MKTLNGKIISFQEGHPISAQELNEEPPLPLPPPPRHPSKAPFDLPEDRSQPEVK